jgi:hypothetical protein
MPNRSVQIAGHDRRDHERLVRYRGESHETVRFADVHGTTRRAPRRGIVAPLTRDHGESDIGANFELSGSDATRDGANASIALERRDMIAPLPREAAAKRSDAAALQCIDLITTQEICAHERIGEMNRTGILDLFAE